MPIWIETKNIISERLKEQLIKKDIKSFYSEKFNIIENNVKDALLKQKTDDALYEISIWALSLWSSDIHYEIYENNVLVRFRIDWILVKIFEFTNKEYKAILERLKYSSDLKLNITDIPQDWKYNIISENIKIDVRVSTLPTKYGENLVCRLLDSSNTIVDFKDLWLYWTNKRVLEKAISKKDWLILVTWPTWSWKTTTLYTILHKLNTIDKKIITLEDPIEYEIEGIIQSEIDEKKSYNFSNWLRAILRQDPDIIMFWEIRDEETLSIATSASLTWHLVLSTLHTKSALDTLDRLVNMGLNLFILASALDTIIAQRLVRKICVHCKVEKQKTKAEILLLKNIIEEIWIKGVDTNNLKLYEGLWCEKCNNTGFKWRIWVYEILNLSYKLKELIKKWLSSQDIINEARKSDFILMKEDGILKAIKWYTTVEEVLRIL